MLPVSSAVKFYICFPLVSLIMGRSLSPHMLSPSGFILSVCNLDPGNLPDVPIRPLARGEEGTIPRAVFPGAARAGSGAVARP